MLRRAGCSMLLAWAGACHEEASGTHLMWASDVGMGFGKKTMIRRSVLSAIMALWPDVAMLSCKTLALYSSSTCHSSHAVLSEMR